MEQVWKTTMNGQQGESSSWKTCFCLYGSQYVGRRWGAIAATAYLGELRSLKKAFPSNIPAV